MNKYISLVGFVLVFETVSYFIGEATRAEVDGWYRTLVKPPLNPPDIVFPIMWTLLYGLIAGTGWVLWRNRTMASGKQRLQIFAAYMAFNWSWTFVFFSAHQILAGLIWIFIINLLSIAIIVKSWNGPKHAALLMIPPTAWTFFAMYLNGGIWWLN